MVDQVRALIVEDEPNDAQLMVLELTGAGLAVTATVADTLERTAAALAAREWDVVLTDHVMSGFTSDAVLGLIRQAAPDLPCIIVSGRIGEEAAVTAMRCGAADYVPKDHLSRLVPSVEHALREAQERRSRRVAEHRLHMLESAIEAIEEGVVITTAPAEPNAATVAFANPGFYRMLHRKPADTDGQPIAQVPCVREVILEPYRTRLLHGEAIVGETVHPLAQDGDIVVEWSAVPIRNPAGKVVHWVSVQRDVTPRRQAETAIQARARQQETVADLGQRALSERDLGALMDAAVHRTAATLDVAYGAVLELTPDGRELMVRSGFGWPAQWVGTRFPADAGGHAGVTLRAAAPVVMADLRRESPSPDLAFLLDHGVISGISVIIHSRTGPFGLLTAHATEPRTFSRDDVNFLQAVANVLAAAVERHRAEAALRESEHHLRAVFDSTMDAILVVNDAHRFVDANPAACALLGAPRAELLSADLLQFVAEGPAEPGWAEFLDRGQYQGEFRLRRADGEIRIVACSAKAHFLPGRHLSVMRDVTERRRAEDLVSGQNRVLQQIASGASLGTVLESIAGVVEPLSDGASCAVLVSDEASGAVRDVIGPHLPQDLITALRGRRLDPDSRGGGWSICPVPSGRADGLAPDPQCPPGRDLLMSLGLADCAAAPMRDETGRPLGALVLYYSDQRPYPAADLPLLEAATWLAGIAIARERAEQALRRQEQLYRLVADNASDLVQLMAVDGKPLYLSPSFQTILGYTTEELRQLGHGGLIHPDDIEKTQAALPILLGGKPARVSVRARKKGGEYIWLDSMLRPVFNGAGEVVQLLASSRDVTERNLFEAQLQHQAFHDPLTGLPNRALFTDRLEHALASAQRRNASPALLFLDLDRFKMVNDSLGHSVGDQLLTAVAGRLQGCVRPEDTIARFGGDEFTILLEDDRDSGGAVRVAERIREQLQAPFRVGGVEIFVTATIGIAVSYRGLVQADDLLRQADVALYRAKNRGKAQHEVYHPGMSTGARDYLELETDLRWALERDELRVHYQPIIALDTGRIAGLEALLRWQHPRRGLVAPDEFIPLAEETGLIHPLGHWVLRTACRYLRRWQGKPGVRPDLFVSVNLSARQLQDRALARDVSRTLRQAALDPACLHVEITESVLMQDVELTAGMLRQLKDIGIRVAVDDFGTGYSSLSYLKRLPVDILKVDRSFVDGLGQDHDATAIVRAIVTLAQTMNLTVTAEGVETAEQLAHLRDLGCDTGQGYYFSRPQPAGLVADLLAANDAPAG